MSKQAQLKVNSWYVNEHRILEQIAGPDLIASLRQYEGHPLEKAYLTQTLAPMVARWVQTRNIPRIEKLILSETLSEGAIFTCDGTFRSKGLCPRSKATMGTLRMKLDTFGDKRSLLISFSTAGLTTESAWTALSGQPKVFVVGIVREITPDEIKCSPYVIGDLIQDFGTVQMLNRCLLELRPEDFDVFSHIDFNRPVALEKMKVLESVPERLVKETFARLFAIVDVQKDWGGETCDLYAPNVVVNGKRGSAAFLLKGPAKFKPMEIADCGKNGDQIDRLFGTDADILILQHCHEIRASVRRTMEMYCAGNLRRQRQFCIINGQDTLKILEAEGVLRNVHKPNPVAPV